MIEDLSFVQHLGTERETLPGPDSAPSGGHSYTILAEAMREAARASGSTTRVASLIFATSFPDLLPPESQAVLGQKGAIFTRGEFLLLRALGDLASDFPLVGDALQSFSDVVRRVGQAAPDTIYHRLADINTTGYGTGRDEDSVWRPRGSGRLLGEAALLAHELGVVSAWQAAGKRVRVILPYVTTPDEQEALQERVQCELAPDQIGVMVENIAHAQDIESYPLVDFVFPGPSDLVADFRATYRHEYREGADPEAECYVTELAQDLAYRVAALGIRHFLAIKFLAGHIKPAPNQLVHDVYTPRLSKPAE